MAALISLAYITMQTFCIPGTLIMSLLSGALYGPWAGLALVCATGTIGACCTYCLSYLVGGAIAYRIWPARVLALREEVRKRRGYMLNYVLFLRVTYVLPNTVRERRAPRD